MESKARVVSIAPQWSLMVKAARYEPTICELTVSCPKKIEFRIFSLKKKQKPFNGGFLFLIRPHKWRAPTARLLRDAVSVRPARVSLTVGQTAGRKRRLLPMSTKPQNSGAVSASPSKHNPCAGPWARTSQLHM